MRIGRFVFRSGKPITAEIEVAHVEVGTGTVAFHEVRGSLRLDGNALALTGFEGRLGEGQVSGVTGLVPLRLDRDVRLSGRYSLALTDLSRLAGTDKVEVLAGTTEGDIALHGRQGRGFSVDGAGTIRDGRFAWRRVALGASGSYTFKDGRVTFAPLVISEAATRLVVRGSAERERADLRVEGVIDGRRIDRRARPSISSAGARGRRRRGGGKGRHVPVERTSGDDGPFLRDPPSDEKGARGGELGRRVAARKYGGRPPGG